MILELEAITLAHRDRVEALRRKYGHTSSAHAFSSLYIWRDDMALSLYFGDEFFAVKVKSRGDKAWFFPCGKRENYLSFVKERLSKGAHFYYMSKEDVDFVSQHLGDAFQCSPTRGDSEYLYPRQEQENLAGRKFMRLRNDINRGQKAHSFTCVPLTEETLPIAKDIHNAWVEGRSPDTLLFRQAGFELLEHFKELKLIGMLGYVDGVPTAVEAGYALSDDIFDLSLSNQSRRVSGISLWTRKCLVASLPQNYSLLNAEEDLDIQGLRQMKEIMRPFAMHHMFEGKIRR